MIPFPPLTTRLNGVVRPSGVPVTVIGYVPAGVALVVAMVSVLAHVGVHGLFVMVLTVAPVGSADVTLRVTAWELPPSRVRVIVVEPDPPAVTGIGPLADNE
jgi:hypothetical protein